MNKINKILQKIFFNEGIKDMYAEAIREIRNLPLSPDAPKLAAEKILNVEKKNSFPIPIIKICTNMGFKIYTQELPSNIGGYIVIDGELKERFQSDRIISVNCEESSMRRRFTVAHELGHFLFDFDPNESILFYNAFEQDHAEGENRDEELRANRFAAELLMPEAEFVKKFQEYKVAYRDQLYDIVQALSDYFLVPPKAVKRRISEELKLNG